MLNLLDIEMIDYKMMRDEDNKNGEIELHEC